MPTSIATDFINFSRGSLATVTDSDGKIKWAGHNLVVSSEQFDSSNWSKGNATVSPNTQVAPNGTTTADTVVTSNAGHYIFMNVTVTPGASYTFSFWAKRGTMTDTKYSVFDAINSVDIIASTSYYSQINSSSFTLVTVTFTAPATCTSARVYPVRDSGVTGTVFVWGAHVYRSDLGGMVLNPARGDTYYPTTPRNLLGYTENFTDAYWFKRATAMTVESNVAIAPNGLPVADRINFSTQFDYIDTAVPPVTVVGTTVTVSVWLKLISGNANLVLRGTAVATNYMQNITVTSEWQRFSATFTHNGTDNIGLVIQDRNSSGFGSVLVWGAQLSDSASLDPYVPVYGAAQTSAAYYAPRIDYDASGISSFTVSLGSELFPGGAPTIANSGTGDNGSYSGGNIINSSVGTFINYPVFSWNIASLVAGRTYKVTVTVTGDARLNNITLGSFGSNPIYSVNGSSVDAYFVATGTGTRIWISTDGRFTFTMTPTITVKEVTSITAVGATTGRGLLVEEQRTNLLLHTTAFDNAVWNLSGVTLRPNIEVAPDGTATADAIVSTGTDPFIAQSVNSTQLTHTFSVWLRGTGSTIGKVPALFIVKDNYADTAYSGSLSPLTANWKRYTYTGTFATAPASYVQARIDISEIGAVAGDTVYAWGAQLEVGSFATSYIATSTTAFMRNKDESNLNIQAFPYNANTGTLIASATLFGLGKTTSDGIVSLTGGSSSENLGIFRSGSSNIIISEMRDNNVAQTTYNVSWGSQPVKAAFAYALNNSNFAVNGVAQTTDTICTLPTVNEMIIGGVYSKGDFPTNGWIRSISYVPKRLTNAELQLRTT